MKREDIVKMISAVEKYQLEYNGYEDPRISSIMNFTGCSRKAAQDLIDSGEI